MIPDIGIIKRNAGKINNMKNELEIELVKK